MLLSQLPVLLATLSLFFPHIGVTNNDYWCGEQCLYHSQSQFKAALNLLEQIPLNGHEVVLDLGCGDGKITASIAHKLPKGRVIGVDSSPLLIEFARNRFPASANPNLNFEIQDVQDLQYEGVFDIVVSFTSLQWARDHEAVIKGVHRSLKPKGRFAVTMPLGLPETMQQAVNEVISRSEWSSFFTHFDPGWNFVKPDVYLSLLLNYDFFPVQAEIIEQTDHFAKREMFEGFLGQWFPYLKALPEGLEEAFMTEVVDLFLVLDDQMGNQEIRFTEQRLDCVVAKLF